MVFPVHLAVLLLPLSLYAAPTVTISHPQATVVGSSSQGVDSFKGIPFAKPPVGNLRLKPPQPLGKAKLGTIQATATPQACPQFMTAIDTSNLPGSVAAALLDSPFLQNITNSGEDCLTLNVQRPSTATKTSKLPVIFWIYGGGFEFGSTQTYDASNLISKSVTNGNPVMYVAVNYRLGGFGFMPGKEILKDGSSNLGLLDQRLGLQWVADNIEQFGGDPSKVTIWGESAGSISVFDQMALYDGKHTYKGKPLFRAGLMDSGSIVPANPVDCPKGQVVYDTVVKNAGCATASDTLSCLRKLPYEKFLAAANSVPAILGYNSVALSYLPRPDGKALTDSPEILIQAGKYAKVPFIVGDQEDEGTLFALAQFNITNTDQLVDYLATVFFPDVPRKRVANLVATYPDQASDGSPFRTGPLYNIYPEYKRLAALLGDITFILSRRVFLAVAGLVNPTIPNWSYLASYDHVVPILGTFHASDITEAYGQTPGFPSSSIQSYYLSFFNTMDPNKQSGNLTQWPQWKTKQQLLNFNEFSNDLLADDFRNKTYTFIVNKKNRLRI